MSIRSRPYAGFGFLALISLALVLFAITQFNGIKSNVATLNTLADGASRVMEIERLLETMRRSTLRYAYDHDQGAAKETEQVTSKIDEMLREAAQSTPSEERRKLYSGLLSDMAATQKVTLSFFDFVKQMEAEQEKLYEVGNDLTDTTNALLTKIRAGSDEEVVRLAEKLYGELLAVRVANWRTQATLDPKGMAILASEVAKASDTIAALEAAGGAQSLRARVGQLKVSLGGYVRAAESYIKHQQQVRDLQVDTIAPKIKEMQVTTATARAQLQAAFGEARTSTESSIARTVTIQEIIAALTLLIGGLIAFFLARSVSNPITALTRSMRELAAGNFGVMLPGLARKDEIGNIARAVDEFKVRAAEKAQREAAEKAEQDRRAEAERRAALAKMADECLGDIVAQAVDQGADRRHRSGCGSRRFLAAGRAGRQDRTGTQRCAISFRCWRLWPKAICPNASFRNIAAISAR
jgi:HAMP domain-containing protein